MSSLFCCSNVKPYRPRYIQHEQKFRSFMNWAAFPTATGLEHHGEDQNAASVSNAPFAVQLVRQVNFGPLESKRYFIPNGDGFVEISEKELIQSNFEKLNSYKNWKCDTHTKFFETDIYQKNPTNKHHWRADIARPASEIDL